MTRFLVTTHGPRGFDEIATAEARDVYRVHAQRLAPAGHRIVCWFLKRDDVRAAEVAAALGATRGEAFPHPAGVTPFESHVPGADRPLVQHRFVGLPPERPPGERPDFDASGRNISFEAFGFTVRFARALDEDEARFVGDVFSHWIAAYSSHETQGYRQCGSAAKAGDTSASFWFDRCTVQTGAHVLVGHARHVVHVLSRFLPVTGARFDDGTNADALEEPLDRPPRDVDRANAFAEARAGWTKPGLVALGCALVPIAATRWIAGPESAVDETVRVLGLAALLVATRRRLAGWLVALGVACLVGVVLGHVLSGSPTTFAGPAAIPWNARDDVDAVRLVVAALANSDGVFVLAWLANAAVAWVREA